MKHILFYTFCVLSLCSCIKPPIKQDKYNDFVNEYLYESLSPLTVFEYKNGFYEPRSNIEKGEVVSTVIYELILNTNDYQPILYKEKWLYVQTPSTFFKGKRLKKYSEIPLHVINFNKQTSSIGSLNNSKQKKGQHLINENKTIITGPKGGKYYINSNGNKTYIKK